MPLATAAAGSISAGTYAIANPNTEEERALMYIPGLVVWMEAHEAHVGGATESSFAWKSRVDYTPFTLIADDDTPKYVPSLVDEIGAAAAEWPYVHSRGVDNANGARGPNIAGPTDKALVGPVYSRFTFARFPSALIGEGSLSGVVWGNLTAYNAVGYWVDLRPDSTGRMRLYHQDAVTPVLQSDTTPDWRDNKWHLFEAHESPGKAWLVVDGVTIAYSDTMATSINTALAGGTRLGIGCRGGTGSSTEPVNGGCLDRKFEFHTLGTCLADAANADYLAQVRTYSGRRFGRRVMSGQSASASLDDAGLSTLIPYNRTTYPNVVIYDATGGRYLYYAFPASFGTPTNVTKDDVPWTGFTNTTQLYTNPAGVTELYRVLRSDNLETDAEIRVEWF